VRDRLEGADRAAELAPLLGIGERVVERTLRQPSDVAARIVRS
jgi:hypothetical protein